ncbi:MAG: peptide chain release factor N(5)-glutamine methyltransferase [Ginsengibacter sp.]
MNAIEIYKQFNLQLESVYESREADNISDWVFENVTGLKKWQRKNTELILPVETQNIIQKYLAELLSHKPVQYVLNEAWFYKRKFFVNEHVLIPRPETEELVEWIINDVKAINKTNKDLKILDIGTGSGCIPISLKLELPFSEVSSIDVSEMALKTSTRNANELGAKITLIHLDFLDETQWESMPAFNIIVSNPPYIPIAEKSLLDKNVTDYEPGIALFVEDNNPFIFYEKIIHFSKIHLRENGKIYVEIHEEYAKEIKQLFEESGFLSEIKMDIYGKQRMVSATII